jgi:hypothetical protein
LVLKRNRAIFAIKKMRCGNVFLFFVFALCASLAIHDAVLLLVSVPTQIQDAHTYDDSYVDSEGDRRSTTSFAFRWDGKWWRNKYFPEAMILPPMHMQPESPVAFSRLKSGYRIGGDPFVSYSINCFYFCFPLLVLLVRLLCRNPDVRTGKSSLVFDLANESDAPFSLALEHRPNAIKRIREAAVDASRCAFAAIVIMIVASAVPFDVWLLPVVCLFILVIAFEPGLLWKLSTALECPIRGVSISAKPTRRASFLVTMDPPRVLLDDSSLVFSNVAPGDAETSDRVIETIAADGDSTRGFFFEFPDDWCYSRGHYVRASLTLVAHDAPPFEVTWVVCTK